MTRVLVLCLAAAALTACATGPEPIEEERSAYGAFLAAQYAGYSLDLDREADFYGQAQDRSPGIPFIADRAFIAAMLAGELEDAAVRAEESAALGDQSRLAQLYLAADRLARGRSEDTLTLLDAAPDYGPFNAFLSDILEQWALAGRGRLDEALAGSEEVQAPGFMAAHLSLHRAFLFERMGDHAEAEQAFQRAYFGTASKRIVAALFGAFLERRGRRDEAVDIYDRYLRLAPNEPSIVQARERARSRGRAPARPSPSEAAARVAFGPAQALAENQPGMNLTALYLRLAQRLDPDYAPARLLLGSTLEAVGQPTAALAEYAAVGPGPFQAAARAEYIMLSAQQGELDEATALAEALVEDAPRDDEAVAILADLYRFQARCEEAAPLYARSLALAAQNGRPIIGARYLWRGACLERTEGWEAAEQIFLDGLEALPNDPELLNHLAYSWLERGVHLEEARAMARRAAQTAPQQGHIIDTLGYAEYLLGDYDAAVRELERAASLAPGNATINAHLGDAYFRVGRVLEAEFQWTRALQLSPGDINEEALRLRLEHGLDGPVEAQAEPAAQ